MGEGVLVAVLVGTNVEYEFGLHRALLERQKLRGIKRLIAHEGQ